MRRKTRNQFIKISKVAGVILGIAVVYILVVFVIPVKGRTLFEKREISRFNKAVAEKEFEKLQAGVTCRTRDGMSVFMFDSEDWGVNSYDVCSVLDENGAFEKEQLKKMMIVEDMKEYKNTLQAGVTVSNKLQKDGGLLGISFYLPEGTRDIGIEYMSKNLVDSDFIPVLCYIKVKRKWYNYLLL